MAKKKPTSGVLTSEQKYKSIQMYSEGMSVEDISKKINKTVGGVEAAILEHKKMLQSIEEKHPSVQSDDIENTDLYKNVFVRLKQEGLQPDVARARLKKALKVAADKNLVDVSEDDLFNYAVKTVSRKDIFITKTQNNKSGVAIMTEAASTEGDDKAYYRNNRSKPDCLYEI